MYGGKVAAYAHVVEIEGVGARKVGIDGRARRLQGCVCGRGQGGGVYEGRVGNLEEQTGGARERRKRRQGGKSSLHGAGNCRGRRIDDATLVERTVAADTWTSRLGARANTSIFDHKSRCACFEQRIRTLKSKILHITVPK